ncbi:MAG: GNAT family N-acetyltransferase [Pseudomonadota bacterium]|nr:GNAT family N-acetyltransferase [Pseudomonadota bacterium]
MTHTIRAALPSDFTRLVEFLALIDAETSRPLGRKFIETWLSNSCRCPRFLVAVENEKIIGASAWSEELFTLEVWGISWVAVHPDRRNKGIGQALVQACLDEISRAAGKTVTVILAAYPDKAKLYERLGFQKSGQSHVGGWFMTKILKTAK